MTRRKSDEACCQISGVSPGKAGGDWNNRLCGNCCWLGGRVGNCPYCTFGLPVKPILAAKTGGSAIELSSFYMNFKYNLSKNYLNWTELLSIVIVSEKEEKLFERFKLSGAKDGLR